MDDAVSFGRRLRHARTDRRMSQVGLASGICSASAVSRWEDGQSVPPHDVVRRLAARLGMDVSVLTGVGFDSRLAESADGFGSVLNVAVGSSADDATSPMASWISRARHALECADPWSAGAPRSVIDDLAVDPLTASSPAALETVELLDALTGVGESPTAQAVDTLVDTLTWTVDAPEPVRRTAVETAVAVLCLEGMPIAAREAVVRAAPATITETTRILLMWDDGVTSRSEAEVRLPPVTVRRTARDVAFSVLYRWWGGASGRPDSDFDASAVADAVVASCPGDGLVAAWRTFTVAV